MFGMALQTLLQHLSISQIFLAHETPKLNAFSLLQPVCAFQCKASLKNILWKWQWKFQAMTHIVKDWATCPIRTTMMHIPCTANHFCFSLSHFWAAQAYCFWSWWAHRQRCAEQPTRSPLEKIAKVHWHRRSLLHKLKNKIMPACRCSRSTHKVSPAECE